MHATHGPTLVVPPFTEGLKQHTAARNEEQEGAQYVSYYVPLSEPVLKLLERLRVLANGSPYLFPKHGAPDEKMSVRTLLQTCHLTLGWDGEIKDKSSPYYRPRITMHGMAASHPACPAPTTTMSNCSEKDRIIGKWRQSSILASAASSHAGALGLPHTLAPFILIGHSRKELA